MKIKKMFLLIVLASSLVLTNCQGLFVRSKLSKNTINFIDLLNDAWVEKTLQQMTLEEKAGQLVFPNANGIYMSEDSPEFRRLEYLVKERKVGGIIFFTSDLYEQAILTNKLQRLSKIPLLISGDFENGITMRIEGATPFPSLMALSAVDDVKLTYEMGKVIALEGRAIGVHQNYAPVSDINSDPSNPIINVRSFGESSELVAKHSSAFIKGLQENGMIATAKHFPGHGNTNLDSHLDLPVLAFSKEELYSKELKPFIQNIDSGVMSIMVGHLAIPAIEKDTRIPASLSQKVITDLLKNELKFNGLIVTDAMNMRAIINNFSTAEATIRALQAGNDCILFPDNPEEAIDAIIKGIKKGELSIERIDRSIRKILAYKKWLGLDKNKFIDIDKISSIVGKEEHHQLARIISRKSITLLKNEKETLPLSQNPNIKYLHLIISDTKNSQDGDEFDRALRKRIAQLQTLKIFLNSLPKDYEEALTQCHKTDIIIISVYLRVRSYQGTIGLTKEQDILLKDILKIHNKKILISHGNPYLLGEYQNVDAYLNLYGDSKYSELAAAEALFGEINIEGKSPISIPSLGIKIGDGISLPKSTLLDETFYYSKNRERKFSAVDSLMEKAIEDSVFPGAVLLVAKDGSVIYKKAYGHFTYELNSRRTSVNSIYDLASLTKVIATTTAAMICYDRGLIDLEAPVINYMPEFGQNGKENITIKNLLLHNSGLAAWRSFYKFCKTENDVIKSICEDSLEYEPGSKTLYSDLGIIILGKVIERVTNQKLDVFCKNEIFDMLGMNNTFYNPPTEFLERIAPTEFDNYWRKKLIHGVVHDETAYLMNGVAGHAGLFSTVEDIKKILQMLLQNGHYQGKQIINPNTVKFFTTKYSQSSSRAFGWDTKSETGSSAGNLFSNKSFGHTGFTGTSCWVDPERSLFVILLSNRVYPTRSNNKILNFRPVLHDKLIEIVDK